MIIGDGDIAQVLKEVDNEDIIFFASGVSNSKETRPQEFIREERMVMDLWADFQKKRFVYFSSLSIFYNDNSYTKHKRKMEALAKGFKKHTIIRLGNISWGVNPHTIINYFKNQIANGELVEVQDTYRYVINKSEFLHWIKMIPDWNCEMNLPGRMMKVEEILNEIYIGKL